MKLPKILHIGCAAMLLTLAAQAQTFLTNGLVAYYPFNGNGNDATGNGNDAVNYGATFVADRFGNANAACSLDGNAAYLLTTNSFPIGGNSSRTMSFWFKYSTPRMSELFCWGDDNWAGACEAVINHTANSMALVSVNLEANFTAPALLTNVWHHACLVYSGNILTSVCYIDGSNSPMTFNITTAGTSLNTPTNTPLCIGRDYNLPVDPGDGWRTPFMGSIDDIRIYNRALSTNEVVQLYAIESNTLRLTQDLTNSSVVYGQNTTLAVAATSQTPINYQWYFSPANHGGQAGAYPQLVGNFVVGAVVTNGGFGYGNIPAVRFVGGGGAGASGFGIVSNGVVTAISVTNAGGGYTSLPSVAIDPPNGFLSGQTNSSLAISNASQSNLGTYYVVLNNGNGSITSSKANLTVLYPPSILTNPVGFTQSYLSSNQLNVVVAGTPPFSYQWFLNDTNLLGATNNSLSIPTLDLTNTGSYMVIVSNPYGYADSTPVDVSMVPSLTLPFTGAVGLWGQPVNLSVGAIGSGTLDYQWYYNGVAIPGATTSSYNLSNVQFTNAGLYSVVVSSTYGSVSNTAYQVVVNPANTAIGTCPIIYLTGTIGYSYVIQSTTDLADTNAWVTVTNLTLNSASQIWADTATDTSKPTNPIKFYRVLAGQ
jgi:hypothetical protein